MLTLRLSSLISGFAFSATVSAFPVCGFDVPEGDDLRLRAGSGCSVFVLHKENYGGLDYLNLYDQSGVDALLSDGTFFIQEGHENYFVSEEADDPKLTLKVTYQEPATSISFNGMHGYTAKVAYFIQVLPGWKDRKGSGYSMNISCAFVVAGNGRKALKTRFCVPQTISGSRQMELYQSLLTKIQPYD